MMAETNDDESLIGYDPLAWMHEVDSQQPPGIEHIALEPEISAEETMAVDETMLVADAEDAMSYEPMLAASGSEPSSDNVITLEAVQTIQNITSLYERLSWALDCGQRIDIDASSVSTIDTATLQLLLIATRTAVKLQREIVIDFPSERFTEAARLLGLSELLDVERSAAGFF